MFLDHVMMETLVDFRCLVRQLIDDVFYLRVCPQDEFEVVF